MCLIQFANEYVCDSEHRLRIFDTTWSAVGHDYHVNVMLVFIFTSYGFPTGCKTAKYKKAGKGRKVLYFMLIDVCLYYMFYVNSSSYGCLASICFTYASVFIASLMVQY